MRCIAVLAILSSLAISVNHAEAKSKSDGSQTPYPGFSICSKEVVAKGKVTYYYSEKKLKPFCNAKKSYKLAKSCEYGEIYSLQSTPITAQKIGQSCTETVTCCIEGSSPQS